MWSSFLKPEIVWQELQAWWFSGILIVKPSHYNYPARKQPKFYVIVLSQFRIRITQRVNSFSHSKLSCTPESKSTTTCRLTWNLFAFLQGLPDNHSTIGLSKRNVVLSFHCFVKKSAWSQVNFIWDTVLFMSQVLKVCYYTWNTLVLFTC